MSLLPWEPLLAILLGLYPAVYLAVLLHEIGHAIAGRLAGYKITSFGLGTGRPFFKMRLPGGTILYLCQNNRLFGSCWATTPELILSSFPQAILLLGGSILNLIVGSLLFLFFVKTHTTFYLVCAGINLLLATANLLPYVQPFSNGSGRTTASDGYQLLALLTTHHHRARLPESQLTYRALWDEIGDTRALRYHLCTAAYVSFTLQDIESASQYMATAQLLPADSDSEGMLLFLQGLLLLFRGEKSEAGQALSAARDHSLAQRAPGSALLAELVSVSTCVTDAEALARWEKIARSIKPSLARSSRVALHLAMHRLLLFFNTPDGDQATLEMLLARYEAARRRYRSDISDARIYLEVAAWRKGREDFAGTQVAWEQAITAIRAVDAAIASDAELRHRYRTRTQRKAAEAGLPPPFAEQVALRAL